MNKIRKYIFIAFAAFSLLFVSCNADILSRESGSYNGVGSKPETSEIFNGAAPENVWASPAYYDDRIIVSFDSVPGADYYEIFKAETDRSRSAVNYNDLNWMKVIYDVSSSSKTRIDYVDTNIDDRMSSDKLYYYTVRAGNYAAGIDGKIVAKFSDPVKGWTLNPPTSLEVSQGLSEEYIELKWSQVDKVKGYKIYYSNDRNADADVWTPMMDSLLPAPVNQETLVAKFIPPKEFLGKDLFFSVASVSFKADESHRSGIRNGYTFIPGAPIAPDKLKASKGESAKYIDISWNIPKKESVLNPEITKDDQKGYFWEIYRYTSSSDPELLYTFNNTQKPLPEIDDIEAVGDNIMWKDSKGKYHFRDMKNLEPNVTYEYSVRASCYIKDSETGEIIPAIGKAAVTDGFIIGPADDIIDKNTEFPSAGNDGSFSFTINTPPKGFVDGTSQWNYRIYGRANVDGSAGSWVQVGSDLPVIAGPVVVNVPYDKSSRINEFSYSVIDNRGNESKSYFDVYGSAIVTELAPAPDVSILNIMSNSYRDGMKASTDGVYPVIASVNYSGSMYSSFIVEALKAEKPNPKTEPAGTIEFKSGDEKILDKLSPGKVGEKWSYRIKGIDVFGRPSSWSATVNGYGAIDGKALIRFVERYAMKPWEFVGEAGFPARLNSKWSSTSGTPAGNLHAMIDKHGLGSIGTMTVYGDYHGGNLYYDSYANGLAGDVVFKFTNFGELETVWSNGGYKMVKVSASGNGDTVEGSIEIGGMYPCTVSFNKLQVRGYAFSGNYEVTFPDSRGTVAVSSR